MLYPYCFPEVPYPQRSPDVDSSWPFVKCMIDSFGPESAWGGCRRGVVAPMMGHSKTVCWQPFTKLFKEYQSWPQESRTFRGSFVSHGGSHLCMAERKNSKEGTELGTRTELAESVICGNPREQRGLKNCGSLAGSDSFAYLPTRSPSVGPPSSLPPTHKSLSKHSRQSQSTLGYSTYNTLHTGTHKY